MQQIDQQSYRQAPQRGEYTLRESKAVWAAVSYSARHEYLTIYTYTVLPMSNLPYKLFSLSLSEAPGVAALALSGDWASEFQSGADAASSPGQVGMGEGTDADWTKEFISEVAGDSLFQQKNLIAIPWCFSPCPF